MTVYWRKLCNYWPNDWNYYWYCVCVWKVLKKDSSISDIIKWLILTICGIIIEMTGIIDIEINDIIIIIVCDGGSIILCSNYYWLLLCVLLLLCIDY